MPEGSLQLVCGSLGDAFDHLGCQDVVSFTGSASTAQKLRTHPAVVANSVRFISETDSINSCVLGPDAVPLDLRYVGPDWEQQDSAHMLLVSNDPYQLDGGSGRGTRVRLDAGTLGVVSLRVKSAA